MKQLTKKEGHYRECLPCRERLNVRTAAKKASFEPLVFNGGPMMKHPELVSLFLGAFSEGEVSDLRNYLHGLAGYMSGNQNPPGKKPVLTQYGVTSASVGLSHVITNAANPLPQELLKGKWETIHTGHELVYLDDDAVLDWEPKTGEFAIRTYDRDMEQGAFFLGGPQVKSKWASIHTGHRLLYLGDDAVLDWEPKTGHFRIWEYDRDVAGDDNPFGHKPLAEGTWNSIHDGHELVYLDDDRVLDWEPATGHYRIWIYDRDVEGTDVNPFHGKPEVEGTWNSIHDGHKLVYLDDDRVLDWEPATGHYRVWEYDRGQEGNANPFPGAPVVEGIWVSVRTGRELIFMGDDRVLDWEVKTGEHRVWRYDSDRTSDWSEDDVQEMIRASQLQGFLPGFSANRLFLVFTKGLRFDGHQTDWCGYHDSWDDNQYFALLPKPTVDKACGNDMSSWQSIISHEVFEGATDPSPGDGWTTGNEEGGDVCAWHDDVLPFGHVQKFEDNASKSCSIWTRAKS